MVTGVSMSLGAEAGATAVTLGLSRSTEAALAGVGISEFALATAVAGLVRVGDLALAVPLRASTNRTTRVRQGRSFFMAQPPRSGVPRRFAGGGVRPTRRGSQSQYTTAHGRQ